MRLANALGLGAALPPNATVRDVLAFLAKLGITPCSGEWQPLEEMTLTDLLCIAGFDPNDPNAPLTISLEELIARILEKYGQLFWIQTQRKVSVSAFAP